MVASVESPDARTVVFHLRESYARYLTCPDRAASMPTLGGQVREEPTRAGETPPSGHRAIQPRHHPKGSAFRRLHCARQDGIKCELRVRRGKCSTIVKFTPGRK